MLAYYCILQLSFLAVFVVAILLLNYTLYHTCSIDLLKLWYPWMSVNNSEWLELELVNDKGHHCATKWCPTSHRYIPHHNNEPYSLFVHASYFISCSIHTRFASVLPIDCKWHWWHRYFWTCRISMFCIEAIELIIR